MNLNSNNQNKSQVNTDTQDIRKLPVVDVFVPVKSNKGTIKFTGGAAHWSQQ
tara:strand:+ start:2994 stop:3149 length:156 start_codon:yes stop_codon:yes gene_type:complete